MATLDELVTAVNGAVQAITDLSAKVAALEAAGTAVDFQSQVDQLNGAASTAESFLNPPVVPPPA